MTSPRSIEEWKALSAEDPEKSANTYWANLDRIPQSDRTRIFSLLPNLPSLKDAFTSSVSKASGQIAGVPYLLKDLFDFPNTATTASSTFLEEVRPGPHGDSAVSHDLRERGAVFGGKTQLNEFAYGLSGENLHYGNCPHPFIAGALSGGSSSGSAWAVSRGIAPIGFGTDTGGSIRVPAAWCGLFGLRLSPDRWSKEGCFPLAPSYDTAGWFCSSAEDFKTSFKVLVTGLGVPRDLKGLDLTDRKKLESSDYNRRILDTYSKLRATTDNAYSEAYASATLELSKHFSVLQSAEALEVHKDWLEERRHQYDPVVWQRIARARDWTAEDIEAAKKGEEKIMSFFDAAFEEYDFITLPASWTSAISAKEHTDAYRSQLLDLTSPGSLARLPIFTIPIRNGSGESTGIQILYRDPKSDVPLRIIEAIS
ncbi:MAG: amidase family protein [Verrucomicrobiota bacterium]|nr:amidase family protein [Verrucomicrobiota bacterium]